MCLGGLLQKREECCTHEEGANHVGLVDVQPFLLGGAVKELFYEVFGATLDFSLAWCDTSVVDCSC